MIDLWQIVKIPAGIVFIYCFSLLIDSAFIIGTQIRSKAYQELIKSFNDDKFDKMLIDKIKWASRAVRLLEAVLFIVLVFVFSKPTFELIMVMAIGLIIAAYVAGALFGIRIKNALQATLNIDRSEIRRRKTRQN